MRRAATRAGQGWGVPAAAAPGRPEDPRRWGRAPGGAERPDLPCSPLPARQRSAAAPAAGHGRAVTSLRAARGTASKPSEEHSSHVTQVKQGVTSQLFFLRVLNVVCGHS